MAETNMDASTEAALKAILRALLVTFSDNPEMSKNLAFAFKLDAIDAMKAGDRTLSRDLSLFGEYVASLKVGEVSAQHDGVVEFAREFLRNRTPDDGSAN